MKKTWIYMIALVCTFAGVAGARSTMHVQVREGQLRERPSYLGTVAAVVDYGDRVTIEREQGPWRYVKAEAGEGWIHESAITRQRVELVAGDEDAAGVATEEEMALAGKGFSEEVEKEFRLQHRDIDFTWVDYMETLEIEPARLSRFLEEGDVAGDQL